MAGADTESNLARQVVALVCCADYSVAGIAESVIYSNVIRYGSVKLINSIFNIKHQSIAGGYMDSASYRMTITNVTFNARETKNQTSLMKLDVYGYYFDDVAQ